MRICAAEWENGLVTSKPDVDLALTLPKANSTAKEKISNLEKTKYSRL